VKIVQKCGPCGGEITVEGDDWPKLMREVRSWREGHACAQLDERGRTGVGFAATSTATDRPPAGWRRDATGPRRVEA
jgi:hypothetical protein